MLHNEAFHQGLHCLQNYKMEFSEENIWAATWKNLSSGVCEQHRGRPACASAQSDQHLCYSHFGKHHFKACYKQNFNFVASPCSWAGWFESHFFRKSRRQVLSQRGPYVPLPPIHGVIWTSWPWKFDQAPENLIIPYGCPYGVTVPVWLKSVRAFISKNADKKLGWHRCLHQHWWDPYRKHCYYIIYK